ncbi:MAG: hypothetical protein JNK47_11130 [Mesorhizobium sp.]|nr:hypothetical protein [Mesorhizobium sp.]MBL8577772.1 hypothetical protein [Mesorhizobium sp.]
MQLAPVILSNQELARERLACAARMLQPAEDVSVTHATALAIQHLLDAAYITKGNIAAVAPEESRQVSALLTAATPRLAAELEGKMAPEVVYFRMGTAKGLLADGHDEFWPDRIDYAGMMAGDLASIHHSEAIAARGFPMLRAIRINLATAQKRDPDQPLH